jgi:signal transduction histidine kinase/CheY-like chemotaxis protein
MADAKWKRWLVPAPGTAHEEQWRRRLAVETQFIAWVLCTPLALVFGALRLWPQAAVVATFGSASFLLHRALLKGARLRPVASISLTLVLAELFASTLFDDVFDPVILTWLALVPMVAGTILGGRALVGWSFAAVSVGGLVLWLERDTWGMAADPRRSLVRAIGMGIVVVVYAWRLEHERQKALWAMADADQLKRRFLANVSHELRTPMNGLLGLTEAMLHSDATTAQREGLEVIHRSGLALVTLLNDLLDLSKMEAGKLIIDPGPVDLRSLARDLTLIFSARAQPKGLSLSLEIEPSVPAWVWADALRLRQVLANLLSNAVKFTPAGRVSLRVHQQEGGALHFAVRDTGVGIAPEILPRLFTSFEQGDAATTRRFGGTGLGLALSNELVTLMGGKLTVETEPNQGSSFSFTLALIPCDAPVPQPALHSSGVRPKLPVLVVDDNPINARVACALLARLGLDTQVAVNGVEAVAAVEANDFCLVLMDCQMPEMDGLEATRRIRALGAPRADVRIVALTASAMTDELQSCLEAGMNDTLTKPVSMAALSRVLNVAPPEARVTAP